MKDHTKLYLKYFGFTTDDFIPCEIPGCGAMAVDICHIDARGMGGNPSGSKNVIENLMAKCREHHLEYGDKKDLKEWLKEVHLKYMKDNGKN
jgi:hypothetical protein